MESGGGGNGGTELGYQAGKTAVCLGFTLIGIDDASRNDGAEGLLHRDVELAHRTFRHKGVPPGGRIRRRWDEHAEQWLLKVRLQRRTDLTGDEADAEQPFLGYSTSTTRRNRVVVAQGLLCLSVL